MRTQIFSTVLVLQQWWASLFSYNNHPEDFCFLQWGPVLASVQSLTSCLKASDLTNMAATWIFLCGSGISWNINRFPPESPEGEINLLPFDSQTQWRRLFMGFYNNENNRDWKTYSNCSLQLVCGATGEASTSNKTRGRTAAAAWCSRLTLMSDQRKLSCPLMDGLILPHVTRKDFMAFTRSFRVSKWFDSVLERNSNNKIYK